MKKIILFIGVLLFVFTMHAFREADKKLEDVMTQLGIKSDVAKEDIYISFFNSVFQYPTKNTSIKGLTYPKSAEVAKDVLAYCKNYLSSPEFRKIYQNRLDALRPVFDEDKNNPEKYMKKRAEEIRKSIKETEESLKHPFDDKLKKVLEQSLVTYRAQLKSYTDPSDPTYASNLKYLQASYDRETNTYKDRLDKFNKEYPPNPNDMIKIRLQKFLDLSATVDYNAELKVGNGGWKVFVNPDYEHQTNEWKACYRAGKETVDAIRAEVTKYLKELK